MADFIPGLELGEQFFTEAAKPIIDTYFRGLRYSAAMLGWSSEVLGYDDVESMDHNWDPASSCSYHRMIMKSISDS